jgi:hypothetical protein
MLSAISILELLGFLINHSITIQGRAGCDTTDESSPFQSKLTVFPFDKYPSLWIYCAFSGQQQIERIKPLLIIVFDLPTDANEVLHVLSLVFPKLLRKPVPYPGYFSGAASLRGQNTFNPTWVVALI